MPTAVTIDGTTTRRPGVYAKPNVSALGGKALDVNRLALIGDFPWLEKAVPTVYSTQSSLKQSMPTDYTLQLIAHLIYNAAADDKVPGAPSAVILVNCQTTTQALVTLVDVAAANSLVVKSAAWGTEGNKVTYAVASGTTKGLKYTFTRQGMTSEVYDDVGGDNVLTFQYTGAHATTMAMAFTLTNGLRISYTDTLIPLGTFSTPDYAFDGIITITPSAAPVASAYTAVVSGIDKATGAPATATLTWPDGLGAGAKSTATGWSSLTSIVFSETGAVTPTFTIAGYSFDLSPTDYPFASLLSDRVDSFDNFTASAGIPQAAVIPTDELDAFTSATIQGVDKSIVADVWAAEQTMSGSALVEVTRATSANDGPVAASGYLSGGTATTAADADVTSALTALRTEDAQILWSQYNTAARHTLIRTHCTYMAGTGGNERNAWVGAAASESKAALGTRTATQNTRHLAMKFQKVQVYDHMGVLKTLDPVYAALIDASIQAGTSVGVPLTHKRPNIVDALTATSINVNNDADELLTLGLCFYTKDRLGWRIERSITTYRTDDNPVYSEVSANESMNTSIRDLRENLETIIGDPAVNATGKLIKSIAKGLLDAQVASGTIRAWDANSLTVTEVGDKFVLSYAMAVTEPTNFIIVEPYVRRFAAAA